MRDMPWHVAKSGGCPTSKPWAVIKDSDSSVVACHPSKADAQKHMAALYANEPHMMGSTGEAGAMTTTDCGCEASHDTRAAVDNGAWDGPAAMSKCAASDTPGTCYGSICAGRKSGDAALQSSWALPHHTAPGAAPNAAGVRAALSRLPQTQGLTNKSAAQAHLEAHLKTIQNAEGTKSADHDHEVRVERPPVHDLLRMTPFRMRATTADGEPNDGRTLDGYAAVFNRETLIDSWEGRFWEGLALGSMKKSFRENPPKIQFDHGRHPMVGSIPIASLRSIAEEADPELAPDGGAHVIGRLFDNWLVQPVRDAIAEQAIDGMSFRFTVVREEWRDHEGKQIRDENVLREALRRTWMEEVPDEELLHRLLREVRVPELGPVVWPAYTDTSVGVRDRGKVIIDLATLRSDPAARRALADAVLLADAAEREAEDPPSVTGVPAEAHRSEATESPQPTVEDLPPAGQHESPQDAGRVPTRTIEMVLRDMRARLKTIPDR